jgi:hypothetical protein
MRRGSQSVLGDTRRLAFVRDIFDWGMLAAGHNEDPIIYVSTDVCLTTDALDRACARIAKYGCCCSGRVTMPLASASYENQYRSQQFDGHSEGGVDLFGFTINWLKKYAEVFPDLLAGCEGWDWVLRQLMLHTSPEIEIYPYITYHAEHSAPAFWRAGNNLTENPGQIYNRKICRAFAEYNGFGDLVNRAGQFLFTEAGKWKEGQEVYAVPQEIHTQAVAAAKEQSKAIIEQGENTFWHAGDIGDIIYSLPTIRFLGGGKLYLCPASFTDTLMTPERAANIATLIECQPYITSVQYRDKPTGFNLNQWRMPHCHFKIGTTLAAMCLATAGAEAKEADVAWLENIRPIQTLPIVISRSARYHNPLFPWKTIPAFYKDQIVFVGTREEHAAFCDEFGHVPYCATPTLLDLAQVIAGAQLFIGNQSAPFAIAEGLKIPIALEEDPRPHIRNCHFEREFSIHMQGEAIYLPKFGSPETSEFVVPPEVSDIGASLQLVEG